MEIEIERYLALCVDEPLRLDLVGAQLILGSDIKRRARSVSVVAAPTVLGSQDAGRNTNDSPFPATDHGGVALSVALSVSNLPCSHPRALVGTTIVLLNSHQR